MTRPLLLPVCTFGRVFDTFPRQEVLTLPELTAAMRRFEIKTGTAHRIERDVARIDKAVRGLADGDAPRGNFMGKLAKVADEARREGRDPEAAVEAKASQMRTDVRKGAKRDLRLWSPALYRPGSDERGKGNVTHVSCMVLDYDDGTSIEEATTTWSSWFHMVYTTWSHRPDRARFRLVLPLAFSVRAEDWAKVWSWAEEHAHFEIDPSMKSPAATYALPAVPHSGWPREAFSRSGAVLDPVDEGILAHRSQLELEPRRPADGEPSVIRGEDPGHDYLDHDEGFGGREPWEEELDWKAPPALIRAAGSDRGSEIRAPAPLARAAEVGPSPPPPEAPRVDSAWRPEPGPEPFELAAVSARLDAMLRVLEARAASPSVVEGLERLVSLHEGGHLTKRELAAAKKQLLADEAAGELRRVGPGRQRRTLCLDFDGVIHAYTSGWRGPTTIPDPPVDGAVRWLTLASERYDVAIFSVRSGYPGAIDAIRAWLRRHGLSKGVLDRIQFPRRKPPAELYIDDRGYRFEGVFPSFDEIGALEPWNKPGRTRR